MIFLKSFSQCGCESMEQAARKRGGSIKKKEQSIKKQEMSKKVSEKKKVKKQLIRKKDLEEDMKVLCEEKAGTFKFEEKKYSCSIKEEVECEDKNVKKFQSCLNLISSESL